MERDDMNNMNRLIPLDKVDDLEVADHDPDVRGWDVLGTDGTKIGEVDQLIVNPAEMKVRYLDVELDESIAESRNNFREGDDRHILIPIGRATIDDEEDKVIVKGVEVSGLGELPAYNGEISRDFEERVMKTFGMHESNLKQKDEFYNCSDFDESQFYGNRRKRSNTELNSCALNRTSR